MDDREKRHGKQEICQAFVMPLQEFVKLTRVNHRDFSGQRIVSGHVTSSYLSPTMGHPIALALLVNGHARKGDQLLARSSSGQDVAVEVTGSVFYDAKGVRQNV